jgi:serine/threonine-protein kinase
MPYNFRAGVHYARGQYAAAVRDHMEALKRDPRHAGTFNLLAWVWSTCPDPDVRNGSRARECATRACELSEWSEPGFLDTLAAAYAECGEFDEAMKWQEKAIENVGSLEQESDYRSRLDLYQQRKPARVNGIVNP